MHHVNTDPQVERTLATSKAQVEHTLAMCKAQIEGAQNQGT
jgi:hypothetical protein